MVDSIPLSRAKKNIGRDFSDAVMMAEVINHYRPKMVSLHNYPTANSTNKKINNWVTLNDKVLKKLGLGLTKPEIEEIAQAVPLAIEAYLYRVFIKFEAPQDEINIKQQVQRTTLREEDRNFADRSVTPPRIQK